MRFLPDRATYRALLKSPGFTAVAVVSLALAIGLTTTTYGIVDAVRHPVSAVKDAEQVYWASPRGYGAHRDYHQHEMYLALRNDLGLYAAMAARSYRGGPIVAGDRVSPSGAEVVSTNYFDVLGVKPFAGRFFRRSAGDHPDDEGVVIGFSVWQSVFNGRTPLSKLHVTVGEQTYPVIGVLPPTMPGEEVVLPMARTVEEGLDPNRLVTAVIRVRPGVTPEQFKRDLHGLAGRFVAEYGLSDQPFQYYHRSFQAPQGQLTDVHKALGAAAIVVLLIACANVANLLLARTISRRRDIAVRMALGASRQDVARFVVGEAVVLAAVGGAAGILLSLWGMHLVEYKMGGGAVQGLGGLAPHLSWRVVLFAFAATAATMVLIAWAAVARARSTNVNAAMKDGAGTTTHRSGGTYRWLVVAELAMSLIVLMGAALLVRATRAVRDFDFGYNPQHVVFANLYLPSRNASKSDSVDRVFRDVTTGTRALPGVLGAEWMSGRGAAGSLVTSDLGGHTPRQLFMRSVITTSPGLLDLLGVRVVQGRDFEAGDAGSQGVAIVDDSVAAALWPRMSPVGRLLKLGSDSSRAPWVRVIGVVHPVQLRFEQDPDLVPLPEIYVVGLGMGGSYRSLVVRTTNDEAPTVLALQRYVSSRIGRSGYLLFQSWMSQFRAEIQERQSTAYVFELVGAFALLLSTVGLYGMLAYTGAQRTREFAMRIALGAQRRDVVRLVLHDALVLVLGGTAVGGFVAMLSSEIIKRLLYSVDPMDAVALVSAEAILIGVSLLAAMGPAMRATRADPVELLRAT